MSEQLWVVWHWAFGGWWPSNPMTKADAERDAQTKFLPGVAKVLPRHTVTQEDVCE